VAQRPRDEGKVLRDIGARQRFNIARFFPLHRVVHGACGADNSVAQHLAAVRSAEGAANNYW